MLSLKFSFKLALVFLCINLFYADLNGGNDFSNIFLNKNVQGSVPSNAKSCDKKSDRVSRHFIVNSLEKATETSILNSTFREKFECMQQFFDQKINEIKQVYEAKVKEHLLQNLTEIIDSAKSLSSKSNDKKKSNKKNKKQDKNKQEIKLLGQTGFISYSMNQNDNMTDFKHESFIFVQPQSNTSANTNQTVLESEIEAYIFDMDVLKAIMTQLKQKMGLKIDMLKAIKSNEKRLEQEQKKALLKSMASNMNQTWSGQDENRSEKKSSKKKDKNVEKRHEEQKEQSAKDEEQQEEHKSKKSKKSKDKKKRSNKD
jgi:hypothetical protein